LRELGAHPEPAWLKRHAPRARQAVLEPLRLLLESVAPELAAREPELETTVKQGRVLGRLGARPPLAQGAFYRRAVGRARDARLFVEVTPDGVRAGLAIAKAPGRLVLGQFRANLEVEPALFARALAALPADLKLWRDADEPVPLPHTADDAAALADASTLVIAREVPAPSDVLRQPGFAADVAGLLGQLYPLWRFATSPDLASVAASVDALEAAQPMAPSAAEPAPAVPAAAPSLHYDLADLSIDTMLAPDFWRDAGTLLGDKRQLVFYGPPGTGKTWLARHFARYWVAGARDPRGAVQVVQFHPAYSYEDFVEGIRPQSARGPEGRHELSYPVTPGLFRRLAAEAGAYPERHYVLILDELNRGELARIFGELLYLLEYRQASVTLPYSGEQFAVPDNLFLLGTMNTADRSLALVDHALRRRFHFVPVRPDPGVLRAYLERTGQAQIVWAADVLELANAQLREDGIEWHLHVGHSHFMRPDLDDARVRLIWDHSVLPTLEEYFYRQPERLAAYQLDVLREALS
jgi:hypothetical protein